MEHAATLFAAQHGVAADRQLRSIGVSLKVQRALIARAIWVRHGPGVVGLGGAPATWERRVMAATLAVPGSLACGRTAARLHRLDGFDRYVGVKVAVTRGARIPTLPGVRYTALRRVDDADRTTINRIPTASIALTLVHLAAGGHHPGRALDDALRRGQRPDDLRRSFERLSGRGVRGPARVLELLADRVDRRLPRSWFQRLAKAVFEKEAVHLVDEWPVRDESGRLLAELDLAAPELMVGVECQSWEWHGSPAAQYRDLRRKRRLTELGWEIIDVWWSDLDRPDEIVTQVRLALARARQWR
jgi:hypothetical protein